MAEARKCDICGKFYVINDVGFAEMILIKYSRSGGMEKKDYYDICTECAERIRQPKEKQPKGVTCATCDVSDLNCREQCRER